VKAKRTWLGLALAVLAVLAVGGLVAPPGGADEQKLKEAKDGEVTQQGEIDNEGEPGQPGEHLEEVAPESVTTVGDNITVVSKTLTPPGDMAFKEFPSPNPWIYVDIETDPEAPPGSADTDTANAIKIRVEDVPETAGAWPLKGEGNLKPPGGSGGGPKEWHWSAKIAKVKLYWETYDQPGDNEPIDDHPAEPANGGKRIFPGKKEYNDSAEDAAKRRLAFAVVEFTEGGAPTPGTEIYFRLWDVDDPSANGPPIDTKPEADPGMNGPDNRDDDWCFAGENANHISHVQIGKVKRFDGTTACEGYKAKMTIRVGMQPGDNWRFAVAWGDGAKARLEAMTQAQADRVQPPEGVVESEMLTTWRKLHIELDSMHAVPEVGAEKNFVAGNITAVGGTGPYTATTDQNLLDTDMYEKGTLVKGGNHTVITGAGANTSGANGQVVVTTNPGVGAFTSLRDDDTKVMPAVPDTGKIDSIFAACYIKHAIDAPGGSNNVNFDLNVGGATTTNTDIDNAVARGSGDSEANGYWVAYLLGGYQAGYDEDNDPDSENGTPGITTDDTFQENIIFLEAIVNMAAEHSWNATTVEQVTVVHELGHQVLENSNHTENTIMADNVPDVMANEKFSDADIATIRGKVSSPGFENEE